MCVWGGSGSGFRVQVRHVGDEGDPEGGCRGGGGVRGTVQDSGQTYMSGMKALS